MICPICNEPTLTERPHRHDQAAYMREWRKRNPRGQRRNLELGRARWLALERLAKAEPDQFRRLYAAACAEVGIDPPAGAGRPPTNASKAVGS